ncbi:MAG: methionyl-tRNA formyltransferase [Nitrospinota bacterium]|nr:methionyl-tRNA formyltransferase [Nitrospinota bacterium]
MVFMGTPDFAVPTLRGLIADGRYQVTLVVSQPDKPKGRGQKMIATPVKAAALEHGVPVIQPVKARNPESVAAIAAEKPDFIVVVAYGQILPLSILSIPRLGPVNLHASLLPRWRGAAPIHRAFLAGDTITGACAMIMEEGLDTGPTLACRKTEITDEDTTGRLHDRLALSGAVLMTETLAEFAAGNLTPRPQDSSLATHAAKLTKQDFIIDWTQTAHEVSLKIRGLSPFPGAVTGLHGKSIKPLFCKMAKAGLSSGPGQVVAIGEEGITVACGSGAVTITELKPEGKAAMAAHAFTLGHDIKIGDVFIS